MPLTSEDERGRGDGGQPQPSQQGARAGRGASATAVRRRAVSHGAGGGSAGRPAGGARRRGARRSGRGAARRPVRVGGAPSLRTIRDRTPRRRDRCPRPLLPARSPPLHATSPSPTRPRTAALPRISSPLRRGVDPQDPPARVADRHGRTAGVAGVSRVTLVGVVTTQRDGMGGKRSRRGVDVPERLSLLLPVWAGDRPEHLTAAFRSTVHEQTRRPDQVVIVRDGPVAPALADRIAELAATSPVPVEVVELRRATSASGPRSTPGSPRAARRRRPDGRRRHHLPHRFAVQMPIIEAGRGPRRLRAARVRCARRRRRRHAARRRPTRTTSVRAPASPTRSTTRPSSTGVPCVRAVGGYADFALMEDYLLWAKMIVAGARVANVAEPLVRYRVGAGAYARRGGLAQLRTELAAAVAVARAGLHDLPPVPAQRGRPRRLPARARGRPEDGLPAAGGPVRGTPRCGRTSVEVKTRSNAVTIAMRLDTIGVPGRFRREG